MEKSKSSNLNLKINVIVDDIMTEMRERRGLHRVRG